MNASIRTNDVNEPRDFSSGFKYFDFISISTGIINKYRVVVVSIDKDFLKERWSVHSTELLK